MVSIFCLVSVAEQAGLNIKLLETQKTGFLALRLQVQGSGLATKVTDIC